MAATLTPCNRFPRSPIAGLSSLPFAGVAMIPLADLCRFACAGALTLQSGAHAEHIRVGASHAEERIVLVDFVFEIDGGRVAHLLLQKTRLIRALRFDYLVIRTGMCGTDLSRSSARMQRNRCRKSRDSLVPTKNPRVRNESGDISVGLSFERSGQSAECYIDRGVGVLPRQACGSSAGTRCGAGV